MKDKTTVILGIIGLGVVALLLIGLVLFAGERDRRGIEGFAPTHQVAP